MSFQQDWKDAKSAFETATDKKKPSEKFLGVFKKTSGVETACKELDSALANPTGDKLAKAEKEFTKAAQDYVKVLQKAAKDEGKSAEYKTEVAKLEKALEQIGLDFSTAKQDQLANAPQRFEDVIPSEIIDGLAKSKFPNGPGVKAFLMDKKFGQSGHDGTALPAAAALQKDAIDCLKTYVTAMKRMSAEKKNVYERLDAWEEARKICADASAMVGPMEGLQNKLRLWMDAQQGAFADGGKQDVFQDWVRNGPLADKIKAITSELTEESVRMNHLESTCQENAR